ncbi:hypothetical protein MP228_007168 [Amoeboaphelidium protococcarum]|nr:hypothetical protein MP228_007168 [Amoeboaphelidium protococcarum]
MVKVSDILRYTAPPREHVDQFNRSAEEPTRLKNPLVIDNDHICQRWTHFNEDIMAPFNDFIQDKLDLDCRIPLKTDNPAIVGEQSLYGILNRYYCTPIDELFSALGHDIRIELGSQNVILDPDFAVNYQKDPSLQSTYILPIEVKTDWDFNVQGELYDEHNLQGTKVVDALQQIYGYMAVNHFRYGILCTYERFYFLRRGGSNGQEKRMLEISDVVHYQQSQPFTAMKALCAIIHLAKTDFFLQSPFGNSHVIRESFPGGPKVLYAKQQIKFHDICFGQRVARSSAGSIVKYGQDSEFLMKIVDRLRHKNEDQIEQLQTEVKAYQILADLQGTCIPTFHGYFCGSGWVDFIVMKNVGTSIRRQLWNDVVQATLPFQEEVIFQVAIFLQELHRRGVAHGDVRLPNVVRDDQGQLSMIDFSDAVFKCDDELKFNPECKRDWEFLANLFNVNY